MPLIDSVAVPIVFFNLVDSVVDHVFRYLSVVVFVFVWDLIYVADSFEVNGIKEDLVATAMVVQVSSKGVMNISILHNAFNRNYFYRYVFSNNLS